MPPHGLSWGGVFLTSCSDDPEEEKKENNYEGTVYEDFADYPSGKENARGMLTVKSNLAQESVLLFDGEVKPEKYIGTIPAGAGSSVKLKLDSGKFHTIVGVCKSVYEEKGDQAAQTSALTYYSDTQAYSITVSPDNLTGAGTWIFNNNTNYWAQIEDVDNSGKTFAVIQPNALRVKIPIQLNTAYDYKVTYKKELKYNDTIVAIVDSSVVSENDTVQLSEATSLTFTTDLNGPKQGSLSADLAPSVLFINNSGRSVRIYNGQTQLSNINNTAADDFVVLTGTSAMLAGFDDNFNTQTLVARSTAWTGGQTCTVDMSMKKGKVYCVTITANNDENATSPIRWTVEEKDASEYYDE
ncbi:MAG: hypothetical protein NC041_01635 [Bacteroides sp.]|nr:hypothetical protein [Prevotella sp.]MCM1407695.1 hypothetical protein [Treponema brennaborense]MCM1469155.1 hypothetical protein [Bacteroides sp.]